MQDLKADNILVEMTGVCKISDFGISKRTEDLHGGAFTAMQGSVLDGPRSHQYTTEWLK